MSAVEKLTLQVSTEGGSSYPKTVYAIDEELLHALSRVAHAHEASNARDYETRGAALTRLLDAGFEVGRILNGGEHGHVR